MSKAIIYEDEKSKMIFTEENKIYFPLPTGGYAESRTLLKTLPKKMNDKKKMVELYLSMNYKEASRLHLRNSLSKGRKGRLYEGEFNEQ